MDILSPRIISSGDTTKLHFEIGHYDREGGWHLLVVSGDLFTDYNAACEAADRQIAVIVAACKKQDARRNGPVAMTQGGAA